MYLASPTASAKFERNSLASAVKNKMNSENKARASEREREREKP